MNELEISYVIICLSVEEVLEKVKKVFYFFDVIFIDLKMFDMDGMELICYLGVMKYYGVIVIIFEMDFKVIDLVVDIVCKNNVYLIGNIFKFV